jgi:hypothetical protein
MGQSDRVQGFAGLQGRIAEEIAGEGKVLLGRERRLQGIAMTHVMQAFGEGSLAGLAEENRAGGGVQASGQDVEEGRLAGAVAAGDHQGLAGLQGERNALEDAALPPVAGQIVNAQTQTPHPCPDCTPEWF